MYSANILELVLLEKEKKKDCQQFDTSYNSLGYKLYHFLIATLPKSPVAVTTLQIHRVYEYLTVDNPSWVAHLTSSPPPINSLGGMTAFIVWWDGFFLAGWRTAPLEITTSDTVSSRSSLGG